MGSCCVQSIEPADSFVITDDKEWREYLLSPAGTVLVRREANKKDHPPRIATQPAWITIGSGVKKIRPSYFTKEWLVATGHDGKVVDLDQGIPIGKITFYNGPMPLEQVVMDSKLIW